MEGFTMNVVLFPYILTNGGTYSPLKADRHINATPGKGVNAAL